jgi:hypothetical protein
MPNEIFVQIPAYRDRELLPTVADLLRTARHPERLTVCIAWQYGDDELPLERALRDLGPVDLLKVPAAESHGCNWARRQLQQCWAGQPYTLLLDSHHRFVAGWDEILVRLHEELRSAGVEKPILTGYLPPYDPVRDPEGRVQAVYRIALAERRRGLMFRLTGDPVPDRPTAPTPACFTSLHLLFAEGDFNRVVPFDPDIYFFADEVAVALRAFTHGYDLFHPHVVLGWHLYDRTTRRPHWADHPRSSEQQALSLTRLEALYGGSERGVYGVGRVRTIADYESWAGAPLVA